MEHPSASERKDILTPAPAGTGLKGVMLGERSRSQKDKTIRSLGHQNHRDRE